MNSKTIICLLAICAVAVDAQWTFSFNGFDLGDLQDWGLGDLTWITGGNGGNEGNGDNGGTDNEGGDSTVDTGNCAEDYQKACLAAHNKYRAMHQAPPLKASKKLQQSATSYAQDLARRNAFEHSGTRGIGENLAAASTFDATLKNCGAKANMHVKMWYDEVSKYSFDNPGFGMSTGHFTQVVWKSTTEVGCGIALGNGKVIGVGHYSPPGNYQGQFPENVLPRAE